MAEKIVSVGEDSTSAHLEEKVVEGSLGADNNVTRLNYLDNTLDVPVTVKRRDTTAVLVIMGGMRSRVNAYLNVQGVDPQPEYSVMMSYSHRGRETTVSTRASIEKTGQGFYIEIKVEGAQTGRKIHFAKMPPAPKWDLELNYNIWSDRIQVYKCGLFDLKLFHCVLKEATGVSGADSDKHVVDED